MSGLALLFEAVAVSLELDDVGVMQDSVKHGRGQRRVAAECLIPLRERQVAGKNHRSAFIALGHDPEEVTGLVARQRQVADLIDDQQARSEHVVAQHRVVAFLSLGGFELQHQIGGRDEFGLDPGLRGQVAQRDPHMRFAHAAGAEQHGVLAALDEAQGGQLVDGFLRCAHGEAVVVLVEGLDRGEAGHANQGLPRSHQPGFSLL